VIAVQRTAERNNLEKNPLLKEGKKTLAETGEKDKTTKEGKEEALVSLLSFEAKWKEKDGFRCVKESLGKERKGERNS